MSLNSQKHHIHFIGVGGIGMSALASILVRKGFSVSGSDKCNTETTKKLSQAGIKIFAKQKAENIEQLYKITKKIPIIVISSAIPSTNYELKNAKDKKITILHRSDILAFLTREQPAILVAGSHGKTTTSTIISTLFSLSQQDPTAIIGGIVPIYKSNAYSGKGKYLIAEADESDGTLVKFKGEIGILTNLELDHTDYYKNIKSLEETIKEFSKKCEKIIVNYDCKNLRFLFRNQAIFYSIKETVGMDFSAIPITLNGNCTIAKYYEKGDFIGTIEIPLIGSHNLSNVLGALSVCRKADISFDQIKSIIKNIEYPKRRFELKGIWEGKQIIDDYAHHPSEIRATISMARLLLKKNQSSLSLNLKRLIVIFQPHRYTRTNDLIQEFALSFKEADLVYILPIFSAGEQPIDGINSEALFSLIKEKNPQKPILLVEDFSTLKENLKSQTKDSDLILCLGAGDINQFSDSLILENNDIKDFAA